MAIKKKMEFKGLVVDKAYIRVVMPTIRPGNKQFEFAVQVMATAEQQPFTVSTYEAAYDLLGPNPLKQAYAHIKSLDEFSGAVDC
jgi:hypothetical protein